MPMNNVLDDFGIDASSASIKAFGTGLINRTWLVANDAKKYILQRINQHVFTDPRAIATNIEAIGAYLTNNFPGYTFTMPLMAKDGTTLSYQQEEGFFRIFPYVEGTHAKDVVETAEQAYEAAAQFGKFTSHLKKFDVTQLKPTILHFHNLSLRYQQFLDALENGNPERIRETTDLSKNLRNHSSIVTTFERLIHSSDFKLRVTHHDTKISNILFDKNDKGICVIDLDTVMPGYFISDVGDMMRTYLSPVSEEEKDYSCIYIRDDFYQAIVHGYNEQMNETLTKMEQQYFFYTGTFMIYMQALRFLTDYLNNDTYYGSTYVAQNLVRAGNQTVLLQRLLEKKEKFSSISLSSIHV